MKKKSILILFCFICLISATLYSQKLTDSRNYFRSGDKLTKQQVEYKDPGPAGKQIEWDFSMLNSIDDKYQLDYFSPTEGDTAHIIGAEHSTRYHYELRNDTLWMTSYENRTTRIEFRPTRSTVALSISLWRHPDQYI
jgi:hypothetical protein